MTGDINIFEYVSGEVANCYWNKFPQSVKLDEPTPKVLFKNITHAAIDSKEGVLMYENTIQVEVIGTNYVNISNVSSEVRDLMLGYTDSNVYHVIYDNGYYATDETAEIHRIITDFRIHVKENNVS